MTTATLDTSWNAELLDLLDAARSPKLRSMAAFAEAEIVLPNGPFEGTAFRLDRQPWSRLWFHELDCGGWRRHVLVGPTQSGKTLCGLVIPITYHSFEVKEKVIVGLPDMDMADDKWQEDFLPVIEQTRYRNLLPEKGSGSRGGKVKAAVRYTHGKTLRFMTGGGAGIAADKRRSGATTRVVAVTEVDGMDDTASSSRESDKVSQLEGRNLSYGDRGLLYLECTLSIESGRINQERIGGSDSTIMKRCPHCRVWVCPEREHLVGWQDAESKEEARELGKLVCPACAAPWSEGDRRTACESSVLVHRGQTVEGDGVVVGDGPRTDTLGFRYNAVDNLFMPIAKIAGMEWSGRQAIDVNNAERKLHQQIWALPYDGDSEDLSSVNVTDIMSRMLSSHKQGTVPADCKYVVGAMDIGKYNCHWGMFGIRPGFSPHWVDYEIIQPLYQVHGTEKAIEKSLEQFYDMCMTGWPIRGMEEQGEKGMRRPDVVMVDARYMTVVIKRFCAAHPLFVPTMGFGMSQAMDRKYTHPKKRTKENSVVEMGERWNVIRDRIERGLTVEVLQGDADYWKSFVHNRLTTPEADPGSMTLYSSRNRLEHLRLARQLTAERKEEKFVAGKGRMIVWITEYQQNHWFDVSWMAMAGAHRLGARLGRVWKKKGGRRGGGGGRVRLPVSRRDGRPFVTGR